MPRNKPTLSTKGRPAPAPLAQKRPYWQSAWFWLIVIALATFVSMAPSLRCGWTNWDDDGYVLDNPMVKSFSPADIAKLFSREGVVLLNYHPLTMFSYALDYQLAGLNPAQYHAVNLVLHVLNSMLVFVFVNMLTKRPVVAGFVALFFGIHPMHVESVTWIAERKDVLYTFFFLLSLIAYCKYSESLKWILLAASFVFFGLSVLSKAMAVVLPVVLILIDFYRGRRLLEARCLIEKTPFFVVSLCFGIIALKLQSSGAIAEMAVFTPIQRIACGFNAMFTYVWKLFLPINLCNLHPYPSLDNRGQWPVDFLLAAFLGIVLSLTAVTYSIWKRDKVVIFGLAFFLITIALVLQFVSVGIALVAERYTYVAYVGLLFALVMTIDRVTAHRNSWRATAIAFGVAIACVFGVISFQRCKVWTNSDTLFTDAIAKYPYPQWRNETPYENRGNYLAKERNELDRGLADYLVLVQMATNHYTVYANMGNIYGLKAQMAAQQGDVAAATELTNKSIDAFTKSIALNDHNATAYVNRAITYVRRGQYNLGFADFAKALQAEPDKPNIDVFRNRGIAYNESAVAKYDLAVMDFDQVIAAEPGNLVIRMLRGAALMNLKRSNDAIADLEYVRTHDPSNGEVPARLAAVYFELGDFSRADFMAKNAVRLGYPMDERFLDEIQSRMNR